MYAGKAVMMACFASAGPVGWAALTAVLVLAVIGAKIAGQRGARWWYNRGVEKDSRVEALISSLLVVGFLDLVDANKDEIFTFDQLTERLLRSTYLEQARRRHPDKHPQRDGECDENYANRLKKV